MSTSKATTARDEWEEHFGQRTIPIPPDETPKERELRERAERAEIREAKVSAAARMANDRAIDRLEKDHAQEVEDLRSQIFDLKKGDRKNGQYTKLKGKPTAGRPGWQPAEKAPPIDIQVEVTSFDGETDAPPPQGWVLDGRIPVNHTSALAGEGGAGKTILVMNLGFCVATGREFLGIETKKCDVLFVDFELKEDDFKRRGIAIANAMGLKGNIPKGVHYWSPSKYLSDESFYDDLRAIIEDKKIGLAIIDSYTMGAGDQDVKEQGPVIDTNQKLANIGTTTLLLDHVSHQGRSMGEKAHPYGNVFKMNACRSLMILAKDDQTGELVLYHKKSNFAVMGAPIHYRMEFKYDENKKETGTYNVIEINVQDMSDYNPHQEWVDIVEELFRESSPKEYPTYSQIRTKYLNKHEEKHKGTSIKPMGDRTCRGTVERSSKDKSEAGSLRGNWRGLYRYQEGRTYKYCTWDMIGAVFDQPELDIQDE